MPSDIDVDVDVRVREDRGHAIINHKVIESDYLHGGMRFKRGRPVAAGGNVRRIRLLVVNS
jgi:hypothetical protein